jgi:tRNA dimethylallyltransferase
LNPVGHLDPEVTPKVLHLFLMAESPFYDIDLIAVTGHTAAGKTALAAHVARLIDGEVISADSRQVYRRMSIGTGKDYDDYLVDGMPVPCHLIDIRNPGEHYSLFEFQRDCNLVITEIRSRGRTPVLCGGTGLYLESVLKSYPLEETPEDPQFRSSCSQMSHEELVKILESFGPLHNITDTTDRSRLLRAIEIARSRQVRQVKPENLPKSLIFGVRYEREERRNRITHRLKERLESGMIEEVQSLLQEVGPDQLSYYGLEYKYLTLYCTGQLSYDEMFGQLNTAIHQFAKRQMTWFRGMEKRGIPVEWIPGEWPFEEKADYILARISSAKI